MDVADGICQAKIHSGDFWVHLLLPPDGDPEAARAALELTGPAVPEVTIAGYMPQGNLLRLHYPPGQPGQRLGIQLSGPFGTNGEQVVLGYDLERVETPRIQLEYRVEGETWRSAESGSSLPKQPLELRFLSIGRADLDAASERLAQQGYSASRDGGSLLLHLPDPPPHLLFDLDALPAADGLTTRASLLELFLGEPPRLVALDPATGQEQVIGELPVNICRVLPSPDGEWAALLATHPQDRYGGEVWMVAVNTGQLYRTPTRYDFSGITPYWRPGELVVPIQNQIHRWQTAVTQVKVGKSQGTAFTALSPDGRYLAGITYDWTQEDEHFPAPATLVLHDLETGVDQLLAVDQLRVRIPHSEIPARLPMAFSPDGSALLIQEPLSQGGWRPLRLEITSGRLEELQPTPARDQQASTADGLQFFAEQPGPEAWIPGPTGHAHKAQADYAEILVQDPSGPERHYGRGLVAGWLPDGRLLLIRWANSPWIRYPSGV